MGGPGHPRERCSAPSPTFSFSAFSSFSHFIADLESCLAVNLSTRVFKEMFKEVFGVALHTQTPMNGSKGNTSLT